MRLFTKLIPGGGIAAFFFFSWVIMRLWNHILTWHLGLLPPLSYLQAAGLWFLIILLFAWVGIGANRGISLWWRKKRDWDEIGEKIERKIKHGLSRWAKEKNDENWDELGEKIEAKVKRGITKWVGGDPDMDWDDLGERIEEKIKHKIRDWAQEE